MISLQCLHYLFPCFSLSDIVLDNITYDPLVSTEIRNSSISTEIIGNIKKWPGPAKDNKTDVLYALCTLDGNHSYLFCY